MMMMKLLLEYVVEKVEFSLVFESYYIVKKCLQ